MMAKKISATNTEIKDLISETRKLSSKAKIWKVVLKELGRSARQRRSVNIYKINKYVRDGEIGLVPGKVLSEGELNKKITVAGLSFSEEARGKINKIGKAISIKQLIKENPKGKRVRIIG